MQRHLVQRIGQHAQIREQVADLLVFPKGAHRCQRAQAAERKRALIYLEVADGPQQHHHLPRRHLPAVHQLGHALCQHARLGLAPECGGRQSEGDLPRKILPLLPATPGGQEQLDQRLRLLGPRDVLASGHQRGEAAEALLEGGVDDIQQRARLR